jgi:outer membrane protein TolC
LLYLQWRLSYRETDLREVLCRQLATRCEQLEEQYAAGTVIKSRLLEVRARKRLADVDLISSRQKTDSLRYELISFIGVENDSVSPDTADQAMTFTLPASSTTVDSTRPELTALSKSHAQVEHLRKVIRSRYLPTLAGLAGIRYGRPGLGMGTDSFTGYGLFGLQLSWNLFDGMKRRAQDEQLRYRLDLIAVERERSMAEFTKTYTLALRQVECVKKRLVAARAASEAAQALVADLETCIEAGTATQAEYLNALVAATQAQLVEEQAAITEKMATLRAMFAAGVTLAY